MAAAQNGRQAQAHAVQLLMRRGADPSSKNLENEQPIQLVPEGPVGDQVRVQIQGGTDRNQCSIQIIETDYFIIYYHNYLFSFFHFLQVRRILKGRSPQVRSCVL